MTFKVTVFRDDPTVWAQAESDDKAEAIRQATRNIPMGWGGHNRSERCLEALRAGQPIETPIANYRLKVTEY